MCIHYALCCFPTWFIRPQNRGVVNAGVLGSSAIQVVFLTKGGIKQTCVEECSFGDVHIFWVGLFLEARCKYREHQWAVQKSVEMEKRLVRTEAKAVRDGPPQGGRNRRGGPSLSPATGRLFFPPTSCYPLFKKNISF